MATLWSSPTIWDDSEDTWTYATTYNPGMIISTGTATSRSIKIYVDGEPCTLEASHESEPEKDYKNARKVFWQRYAKLGRKFLKSHFRK